MSGRSLGDCLLIGRSLPGLAIPPRHACKLNIGYPDVDRALSRPAFSLAVLELAVKVPFPVVLMLLSKGDQTCGQAEFIVGRQNLRSKNALQTRFDPIAPEHTRQ